MSSNGFKVPEPKNEPVLSYAPGTKERAELTAMLEKMRSEEIEIPMVINGEFVKTDNKIAVHPPHDIKHTLGHFYKGDASHVKMAIDAALAAKDKWINLPWEHRASIFLKIADLLAGPYRAKINAATMLGQSKTSFQAEIDAACELADFFRFNVKYMTDLYAQQPDCDSGMWKRLV